MQLPVRVPRLLSNVIAAWIRFCLLQVTADFNVAHNYTGVLSWNRHLLNGIKWWDALQGKVNIPNVKLLWVNFVGWNLAEEGCAYEILGSGVQGVWEQLRKAREALEGELIKPLCSSLYSLGALSCCSPFQQGPVLLGLLPGCCWGSGFFGGLFIFKGHQCTFRLSLATKKNDFVFFGITAIATPECSEAGRFPSFCLAHLEELHSLSELSWKEK